MNKEKRYERRYNIGEYVYFPFVSEHGVFRLMQTRIVAVEEEHMSIYSFAYYIYVGDKLYRVHMDDLYASPEEFKEGLYQKVVNL